MWGMEGDQKRKMRMNVGREPCILYETVELLYAYINGISADRLTMDRVYCIPAPEIARLMGAACAGVDRQDPDFRRFFARRPILDEHSQFTCLAFCMVYWFIRLDTTDMTLQMDRICANWERIRRQPFTIRAINRYALDVEALPEGRPGSLAAELKKLPAEEDFLLILLEVFSDYTYQMNCLRELIMPIARRLQALLEPFVAQAEPLRETWDRFFQETSVEDFVMKRAGTTLEKPLEQAGITLRYLGAHNAAGYLDPERNSFFMHLGVAIQPTLQQEYEQEGLNERELASLRLLGDKGRSEMVQALMEKSMSMQELATHLGLNPGTVFRNLNSLTSAELLTKEVRGGRYYYRTDFPFIQAIFQHMLDFYQKGGSIRPG